MDPVPRPAYDLLDVADRTARPDAVGLHDDLARDRRLEVADTVSFVCMADHFGCLV